MIQRISQSFIKDFREYLRKELCGNIIREKYIHDRLIEDPSREPGAMELGCYFEFITFGALPKNGKPPAPQYMDSKIKANGGKTDGLGIKDMYEDYRTAHENSEITKRLFSEMGFKIIAVGQNVTRGRFTGTWDLVVECEKDVVFQGFYLDKGQRIIIDGKYSGLLSDTTPRTNKHGWKWSKEQMEYHGTQAKQYYFLGDASMQFFFWVVSSSAKNKDIRFFHIPMDQHMLDKHIMEGNDYFGKLELLSKTDALEPYPEYLRCMKCPLRETCTDKITGPQIETVNLYSDGEK